LNSSTDSSGATTQYKYVDQNNNADPLWRVLQSIDPLSYTTWTIYSPGTAIPATGETVLSNSATSAVDTLTTFDGLMRPILKQTRTAPGSTTFDTVVIRYDPSGRAVSVGIPCEYTASSPCASSTTTTTYDGLDRPLKVTDGGGGYTSYAYSSNDTLQTTGPAPTGENVKVRQMQYDGMGRLTSVCEVTSGTSGWPGRACGQTSSQTGYLTSYSYSGPGNVSTLTSVTQNAQGTPQTRAYSYDGLNRLYRRRIQNGAPALPPPKRDRPRAPKLAVESSLSGSL